MKLLIAFISLMALLLAACTKVIDVDLNSTDPRLVVEGRLSDSGDSAVVRLSRTVNFSDPNTFPEVANATVSITDENGTIYPLEPTEPGLYQLNDFNGVPNSAYTLTIATDDEVFTSTAFMPMPVPIDTIVILTSPFGNPFISVEFTDPPAMPNYYRLLLSINGKARNRIYIIDDRLQDGQQLSASLFGVPASKLTPGDTIAVTLQSIDRNVYEFFRTLLQLNSGQPTTSPANPLTNMSGGALGYFSAHAETRMTVVLEE